MKRFHNRAKIVQVEDVARDTVRLCLQVAEIADQVEPGQFVMLGPLAPDSHDPFLNRPFSVHACHDDIIELLIGVVGRGSRMLSEFVPGQDLYVLGPLGSGFQVPAGAKHMVLVGGGLGIAPLFYLAQHCSRLAAKTVLLYGAGNSEQLLSTVTLTDLGVELALATDDGSAGHHGHAGDLLLNWIAAQPEARGRDTYLATCGPEKMMAAVAAIGREHDFQVEVSLEARMACGVGACLGCTAFDVQGKAVRVCHEGPVFPAGEVFGP